MDGGIATSLATMAILIIKDSRYFCTCETAPYWNSAWESWIQVVMYKGIDQSIKSTGT